MSRRPFAPKPPKSQKSGDGLPLNPQPMQRHQQDYDFSRSMSGSTDNEVNSLFSNMKMNSQSWSSAGFNDSGLGDQPFTTGGPWTSTQADFTAEPEFDPSFFNDATHSMSYMASEPGIQTLPYDWATGGFSTSVYPANSVSGSQAGMNPSTPGLGMVPFASNYQSQIDAISLTGSPQSQSTNVQIGYRTCADYYIERNDAKIPSTTADVVGWPYVLKMPHDGTDFNGFDSGPSLKSQHWLKLPKSKGDNNASDSIDSRR